ncbi:HAD family hydrolase [Psychromarinibacter halotolerans]|uniref:phosphoglycolate phosphatase n=1 Tax=Psychromarinibacter halotolerans TaxID=1775175 RepID=A0ABV7GSH9_9RHOB|nr:HAD family hydrolase [Psychromarinibacter halotolerans]MDF0597033.1 HAD family hydrolase [Psychromarinibacter halotolerans]
MAKIQGLLFDKDGTLFDFEATWNAWAAATLTDFAQGDIERASELGARIGFDFAAGRFDPGSPVIAGTPDDIVLLLGPGVPELSGEEIVARLNANAAKATQVEAVPLVPLFTGFRDAGLKLGIATNDAEVPARAHIEAAGLSGMFDFIAGYDSGHGGKPDPGMCLAFAEAVGLAPGAIAMIGDSTHDLEAGRAAGMHCVAVLTGMADADTLAPHADIVLRNIGEIDDWLAVRSEH